MTTIISAQPIKLARSSSLKIPNESPDFHSTAWRYHKCALTGLLSQPILFEHPGKQGCTERTSDMCMTVCHVDAPFSC